MKKALGLLLVILLSGASSALADVRSDSLNVDPRFIDDVDLIWFYPNLVTRYENLMDTRTNNLSAARVWGGLLDGEHTGLGVIGAYVNRPFSYQGTRASHFNSPGWLGTGVGWNGNWQIGANNWTLPNVIYNGHFTANTPENKLDLFWGTTGDKGNFGIQVNYADAEGNVNGNNFPLSGTSWNQQNNNNASSAAYKSSTAFGDSRVIGINLGLGTADFGLFNSANFHVGYSMGTLDMEENNIPNTNTTHDNNSLKDNGIYTLSFGALFQNKLDENSDLRLFTNFDIDQNNQTERLTRDINNDGLHNDANDVDEQFVSKYNDVITTLGLGCNHKVLDGKATLSSGLQVFWIGDDTKLSASQQDGTAAGSTIVPQLPDDLTHDLWDFAWNAAVEAKVTNWLTLRTGINRPFLWRVTAVSTLNVYSGNTVQSTSKTITTYDGYFGNSGSTYTIGFGINFENFQLDARASTASLFGDINNIAPGRGILFGGSTIPTSTTLSTADADIRYQF